MADISMCQGKGCALKDVCYRHTANASQYQSYLMIELKPGATHCEMFWPDGTSENIITIKDIEFVEMINSRKKKSNKRKKK